MSKYCGTSPCDALLESRAHGRWLKDATPTDPLITFAMLVGTPEGPEAHLIQYCPFCGTKLDHRRSKEQTRFVPKRQQKLANPLFQFLLPEAKLPKRAYSLEEMERIALGDKN